MKHMIKLPALLLGLMLLLTGITQKAMAQDDDISLESFYDELSPYGTWIQDPEYGYVWRPDVDQNDFRPYYTNGRWAMTEYGNTWVSDYDWGWAPFHYGRWVSNRYGQWIWLPDTVWGPAWVSWRSGGGYYGWAPMGPGFNININIGGGFNTPNDWWVFIPQRNIYSNYYPRYSRRNVTIYNQTTIINNTYGRNRNTYYTGPRADDIRRATNRDVRVYNISRSERPGRTSISNNNINIYNPRGGRSNNGQSARPGQPDRGNSDRDRGVAGRGNNQSGQRPEMNGRNGQPRGQDKTPQVQQRQEQMQREGRGGRDQRNGQQGDNEQRQQQAQQRQEQQQRGNQERQQRDNQQRQQQAQQRQEQQQRGNQERQQQAQQRQEQARQQQDQQRQQQSQQRQEQQQRQQQEQQQRQQQSQQRQEQARQQQDQQRQQQSQQRQEQARQQQDQQRQQQSQQQQQGRSSGEGRSGRGGRN
ncbi:MAG: hypothetical protein MUP99_13800 [Pedobacter sp.]|nr:hypothetical protein [Pedobacter sp.]